MIPGFSHGFFVPIHAQIVLQLFQGLEGATRALRSTDNDKQPHGTSCGARKNDRNLSSRWGAPETNKVTPASRRTSHAYVIASCADGMPVARAICVRAVIGAPGGSSHTTTTQPTAVSRTRIIH